MNTQYFQTRQSEISQPLFSKREDSFAVALQKNQESKIAVQTAKIERYARANHHVLLTGERGTGKTTIARQIHDQSARRKKQFVSLNCATLKEELVEAELFGYEKGAFTGANQMKAGLFEIGSGGTVFLDEVGELSLSLQAKLLKAVEEKRIRRVGSSIEISVDLRVIAATSRNLREMTARGEFRHDLYDRLNVLSLNTIPLREQREKIRELVFAGLEKERVSLNRRERFQIESSAVTLLENYVWTGNFRELQNFILKLAIECADAEIITRSDISLLLAEKEITEPAGREAGGTHFAASGVDANCLMLEINLEEHLDQIIERVKERYIRHHLKEKGIRRTSEQCGIARSMIRRIIRKSKGEQFADVNL